MNTRINAKLLFTYSVFLLIISFISIFFYLKFKRINNVFKVSVREYELIVKINKLKVRYFGANDFANLKKSELDELNREIIDIRRTVEELSLKEKNFKEFYRNITEKLKKLQICQLRNYQ